MPRRFIAISTSDEGRGDQRLVAGRGPGSPTAAFCTPDEMDTATVST